MDCTTSLFVCGFLLGVYTHTHTQDFFSWERTEFLSLLFLFGSVEGAGIWFSPSDRCVVTTCLYVLLSYVFPPDIIGGRLAGYDYRRQKKSKEIKFASHLWSFFGKPGEHKNMKIIIYNNVKIIALRGFHILSRSICCRGPPQQCSVINIM